MRADRELYAAVIRAFVVKHPEASFDRSAIEH